MIGRDEPLLASSNSAHLPNSLNVEALVTHGHSKRQFTAGLCVVGFLLTQVFQELALHVWIPAATTPEQELLAYLLPIDRARALLVMVGILLLMVPFAAIALRYRRVRPVASLLGFTFGFAFVLLELLHRSIDLVVVGRHWALQFSVAGPEREVILQHFADWNQFAIGVYLPLMLSYLLASLCFAFATAADRHAGKWYWLAPIAYSLNAMRLLARMASTYAGQHWLEGFNDDLYFPAVLTINTLVATWFFYTSRGPTSEPETVLQQR